jgi:predicted ATPase
LPGRTVIVEQPETHLHPKQQADLGEILASSLALQAEGGEGSTFIIETHSINILERLGKIIRETSKEKDFKGLRLKPGEVGVYYVDAEETTSVKLRRMELRDDGKLKRKWPGEFFNEDMNDLF